MRNKRFGFVLPLFAALCLSSAAGAQQSRPSDDNGGDYRPEMADPYRGYSDYPAAEVRAIPHARAAAVRARLEAELIQNNMHRWIARSWDDFSGSKDYTDATAAERKAQDDYNRERERVLKRLREDSNYRALSDLVADMNAKIDRERPRSMKSLSVDATSNMLALATAKLGYQSQMTAMEAAALNADNGVQDARGRLTESASRSRDMRRGFERSIRRDPEFLASRARYDEARINKTVASAFLESAINARTIALDYAYYVHRWDQYKYSTGYYNYPYYGYGGAVFTGGYMRRY